MSAIATATLILGLLNTGGLESQDTFDGVSDSTKVFLVDVVPIGADTSVLLSIAPGVVEGEGGSWVGRTQLFGVPAGFQASTLGGRIYSLGFQLLDVSAETGDSLHVVIEGMYSQRWGPAHVGDGQDSPYYVMSRSWCPGGLGVAVTNSLVGDRRNLGLGFQCQCPHDYRMSPLAPCGAGG